MDYMEQSIIHIKAPHEIHIGAKVLAAQRGISMNQLIVDLIEAAINGDSYKPMEIKERILAARKATPEKVISRAAEVYKELTKSNRFEGPLCKIHGTPLDARGKCLQKGCKYS
jgi:hypothetical protein